MVQGLGLRDWGWALAQGAGSNHLGTHSTTKEMFQKRTPSIPAGNGHLKPSRPRLVPARPNVCTSHVREAFRFSKDLQAADEAAPLGRGAPRVPPHRLKKPQYRKDLVDSGYRAPRPQGPLEVLVKMSLSVHSFVGANDTAAPMKTRNEHPTPPLTSGGLHAPPSPATTLCTSGKGS